MGNKQLDRKDILRMIEKGEISSQRGLALIAELMNKSKLEEKSKDKNLSRGYYYKVWKNIDQKSVECLQDNSGNILVFDMDNKVFDSIGFKQKNYANKILVKPGTAYAYHGDNTYEINPLCYEDYKRLLDALESEKILPEKVLHLWSRKNLTKTVESLNGVPDEGVYSVFMLTKAFVEKKLKNKVRMLYSYTYAGEEAAPDCSALSGFAFAIYRENPQFIMNTLCIHGIDEGEALNLMLNELDTMSRPLEIKYTDQGRFIRQLREARPEEFTKEVSLKNDGVYLITGGAGGIGQILAEYISKLAGVKLVLTGRSELDEKKETRIAGLSSEGTEITYIRCDITKKSDVKKLLKQIKTLYGKLNGIIHCAGSKRDALIINKEEKDIKAVLSPKVTGTILLDEVTKNERLDFFVLFSSVVSIIGNAGQSDYAYANSFMDDFASYRDNLSSKGLRWGNTLSINWPLWNNAGMKADDKSIQWMEEMLGMKSINADAGFDALKYMLKFKGPQLMVIEGDTDKFYSVVSKGEEPKEGKELAKSILGEQEKAKLKEKTEEYLKGILSRETKIPIQKIRSQEQLEKYGIDSMIIMNLNRELERDFGTLSKTLFFEYQSIDELAKYFVDNYEDVVIKKVGSSLPLIDKKEDKSKELVEKEPVISRQRYLNPGHEKNREKDKGDMEIAIVGLSGRYPNAKNVNEFWDNLKNGVDCISEIPMERWDYEKYSVKDKKTGKSSSKWGGFISDADKFDALFFNISPREAELMDPQERLFVETVWHTIEDAGYSRGSLEKSKVGVFVGVMYGQYQLFGVEEVQKGNMVIPVSSYASIANRVSYFFNFHGPSIALDTMCSSSLTAIHLACNSILKGECDAAVAGGVNLSIHPYKYMQLNQGNFSSSDGRCRSFGEGGDGYVPGEGVGAVMLKPLSKAVADRDHIYAVIKSSVLNHGGKTNGYTVPNPNAQAELILQALKQSGVNPRKISYLEAHGTGTSLGDPIEITGLSKAYRQYTQDKQYCSIGSVKSNIGHLESAAGIAGLTKLLLQLKYKQLVPSLHSDILNSNINFSDSPFYVQHELKEWEPAGMTDGSVGKRIAGLSSFGAGGANAHILLEEYMAPTISEKVMFDSEQVIVLSAKNRERLKEYAKEIIKFLEGTSSSAYGIDENGLLEKVQRDILKIVSQIINVSEKDISIYEDVQEYGLEPVSIAKVTEEISQRFDIDINASVFSDNSSINLISEFLIKNFKDIIVRNYGHDEVQVSVKAINASVNLAELAYTLQVGREAFDERIAIIANSTQQLMEKLEGYCGGKSDVEGLFAGNVKDSQMNSNFLFEGSAGETFIRMLIDKREMDKLAQLWISGVAIEWRLLYGSGYPQKISLPTYPFAKDRYWISITEKPVGAIEKLHPLLDRNTSNLRELRFSTRLDENEFYIKDYSVDNQKVLPGSVAIEMARAAGDIAGYSKVKKLRDIVYGMPVIMQNNFMDIEIGLYPNRDLVEYEMSSTDTDGGLMVHFQGKIVYENALSQNTSNEHLDIYSIKERCTVTWPGEDCYRLFKRFGLNYGPEFSVLKEVSIAENEVIAKLELSGSTISEKKDYVLPPTLIEGALQTVSVLMANSKENLASPYVPYSIREVDIIRAMPESCYVYVVKVKNDGLYDDSEKRFDIAITDISGEITTRINNLAMRPVDFGNRNVEYSVQAHNIPVLTAQGNTDLDKRIEKDVRRIAAEIIKIDAQKIDINGSFGEFGFDSISMKEFSDKISETFGIEIQPTVFYTKSNIKSLSEYIASDFENEASIYYKTKSEGSIARPGRTAAEKIRNMADGTELKPLAQKYGIISGEAGHWSAYAGRSQNEPVAIIGMYGTFPQSENLEEFWRNLDEGKDLITEVPIERWDWRDFHSDYVDGKLKSKSKWGGFIPDVDKFDPKFFNISPAEAEMMDPQQRLFLQVVWKTIEDAGYKASDFSGRNIGVFAGIQFNDYQTLLAMEGESNPMMGLGNEHSIFVNRISYLLNLHGPSEPYNTACSSTGVAIHRAVKSVQSGESELALAGGISLMLSPFTMISADQMGILSPDGRCKTLDKSANGYVKGEGVGALLLKPLSKAMEDGDHIYAVIKGTAVNHGGKAASLTAPNSEAQAALLVAANEEAGFDPDTLSYLELHGTGTELGDPIEIEGIKAAFKELSKRRNKIIAKNHYCGIGSVKTYVGHLEPASGIVGIMKVVLSMQKKKLPGMLHLKEVNPYVNIENTPFYIVKEKCDWNRLTDEQGNEIPRRAGISSFGFGGVNSHIVLEEFAEATDSNFEKNSSPKLFVLSAKTEERLKAYSTEFINYIKKQIALQKDKSSEEKGISFDSFIYTMQIGREVMGERLACIVSSLDELLEKLTQYNSGQKNIKGFYRQQVKAKRGDSDLLIGGEARKALINDVILEGDLDRIAQLWVLGEEIDWDMLYTENKLKRIPLPTYPFLKERYWAPKNTNDYKASSIPQEPAQTPAAKPKQDDLPKIVGPFLAQAGSVESTEFTEDEDTQVDYIEYELKVILSETIKLDASEIDEERNLAEYGVDSIISSIIMQGIEKKFASSLPLSTIVEHPTVRELAAFIKENISDESVIASKPQKVIKKKEVKPVIGTQTKLPPELVPLNKKGNYQKVFFVHGGPGYAAYYTNLSEALGSDYPFYAFQAKGVDGKSIPLEFDEIVDHYISCIRIAQPEGPYIIGGYSFGGYISYEIAQRLHKQGEEITELIIFDTYPNTPEANELYYSDASFDNTFFKLMMGNEFSNAKRNPSALITPADLEGVPKEYYVARIAQLARTKGNSPLPADEIYNYINGTLKLIDYAEAAYNTYKPEFYTASEVLYFKATKGFVAEDNWMGLNAVDIYTPVGYNYLDPWRKWVKNLKVVEVPCDHFNILEEPSLSIVVNSIKEIIKPEDEVKRKK